MELLRIWPFFVIASVHCGRGTQLWSGTTDSQNWVVKKASWSNRTRRGTIIPRGVLVFVLSEVLHSCCVRRAFTLDVAVLAELIPCSWSSWCFRSQSCHFQTFSEQRMMNCLRFLSNWLSVTFDCAARRTLLCRFGFLLCRLQLGCRSLHWHTSRREKRREMPWMCHIAFAAQDSTSMPQDFAKWAAKQS